MRTSEAIGEVAAAAAKAQHELKPAVKDALNPAFHATYADEAAIREASRVYAKYGIAIFQEPVTVELGVAVTTLFAHSSGQWIEFGPLTVPVSKRDAHGVGSATTYAKKYALAAAAGIAAAEDDDGNAAVAAPVPPAAPAPPPRTTITDDQRTRLFTLAKKAGWTKDAISAWLKDTRQIKSSKDIPQRDYDAICEALQKGPAKVTPLPIDEVFK